MAKTKIQNRPTKNDPILADIPMACADERVAVEFLEKQRWGSVPRCPHCASSDVYQMRDSKTGERQANFRWRCRDCKVQYTVRTSTVFEDSRIPLRHWCFTFWRASTSKKGVSALEIHRQTGISYKSSLFMLNRIRFAMSDSTPSPLGPGGGDVEVDEVYIGGKPRNKGHNKRGRGTNKQPVLGMAERGDMVKTIPIANVTGATLKQAIRDNINVNARIITDENSAYHGIGEEYGGGHETTCHSAREYVRGDIHGNTIEGFFSLVKRGINGIYHSVSKEHLHRYLAEFEFRYNHREISDGQRTKAAILASAGKRLTYKETVYV
ncbi:MAG: IS1595 family transposase [Candidatus Competibacteraceae bacterium]